MKSKMSFFIEMFTRLTTIIFICSSVYIFIFNGFDSSVSLTYILGVLGISFILSLARLPLYTDKILSRGIVILLNFIYFLFADAVVLVTGLLLGWFSTKRPATIIGMEITFLAVFALISAVLFISSKRSEEKLNSQLKKIQEK